MEANVSVNLDSRSYDIIITQGIKNLGLAIAERFRASRLALVADQTVTRIYGMAALESLKSAGFKAKLFSFPTGEKSKSLNEVSRLYDMFVSFKMDRKSVVVALGGGVTGDLAGFAAATFMRGIPYIQVPTTLLAQVDSSVGGKTGVNHETGKNLIGSFHQPSLVYTDLTTLRTLPRAEFLNGMAEVVKHGMIRDAGYFQFIEDKLESILELNLEVLEELVRGSCAIKARVVGADERENNLRAILNFGHTAGHAFEVLTNYSGLRHGEAVSLGMMVSAYLGGQLCRFSLAECERLEALLKNLGLPTTITGLNIESMIKHMLGDKKAHHGIMHFVLPHKIGLVEVLPVSDLKALRKALKAVIQV
ncbi:MAG: 3-dehydroquinate synthase [Planctomycetes bacterium]|nr:3-dehydroquinate synthase [Planctomycetota bacterium]